MSKQSEAKKAQGYVAKAVPSVCMNCIHYKSEMVEMPAQWSFSSAYTLEKNKRCGLGGFAVSKQGTCDYFTGKAE